MNGADKPAAVDGVSASTVKIAVSNEKKSYLGKVTSWFAAAGNSIKKNRMLIAVAICWLVLLYGIMTGYFVALYEIALAVRKENYLRPSQSRLRSDKPPLYTDQPAFPWQTAVPRSDL